MKKNWNLNEIEEKKYDYYYMLRDLSYKIQDMDVDKKVKFAASSFLAWLFGVLGGGVFYNLREQVLIGEFKEKMPNGFIKLINEKIQGFNDKFGTNLVVTENHNTADSINIMNIGDLEATKIVYHDSAITDVKNQIYSTINEKATFVHVGDVPGLAKGDIGQIVVTPGSEDMVIEANKLIQELPTLANDYWQNVLPMNEIQNIAFTQSIGVSAGIGLAVLSYPFIKAKLAEHKYEKLKKEYKNFCKEHNTQCDLEQ